MTDVERLLGFKRTMLAIRDAAICMAQDNGISAQDRHMKAIEKMYMDAALLGKFTEIYFHASGPKQYGGKPDA